MGAVVKSGLKLLRTVAGEQRYREMRSGLKGNYAARNYRALKGRVQKRYFDDNYALFWAGSHRDNRVGIYAYGSCDLPPIFAAIPSIQRVLDGRITLQQGLHDYRKLVERYRWPYRLFRLAQSVVTHVPGGWIGPIFEISTHPDVIKHWWPRYSRFGSLDSIGLRDNPEQKS